VYKKAARPPRVKWRRTVGHGGAGGGRIRDGRVRLRLDGQEAQELVRIPRQPGERGNRALLGVDDRVERQRHRREALLLVALLALVDVPLPVGVEARADEAGQAVADLGAR